MKRLFLILLMAGLAALSLPMATAQSNTKDPRPGYMVIRVVLDDGGGSNAPPDPNNPNAQPQTQRPVDPTKAVAVAVPYQYIEKKLFASDKTPNALTNPYWPAFRHKYGMCYLYSDKSFCQIYPLQGVSLDKQLKDAYDKWAGKRSYDGIHEIIEKALMMGKYDEAAKYCEEYAKMPKLSEAPQTERFKAFLAAYTGLPEKLAKSAATLSSAEEWKSRIGATNALQGDHYTVFSFDGNSPREASRRLKVLDSNFKAFFLWHALNGLALPVPTNKMIAVVLDSPSRMKDFRDGLDGIVIKADSDAIYSPSHDILVLSPERLDTEGRAYFSLAKARFAAGWNRDELLAGKLSAIPPVQGKAAEAAQMMMLAVADQALIEEGDNAAIAREGSRQLLAATGMIPANIRLPHWLECGLGFYFQRAKGNVYLRENNQGPMKMAVALASGIGAPNLEYHRDYDKFKTEFGYVPGRTLVNVLTNDYYAAAAAGRNIDPKPIPPRDPNNPNANPMEPNDPNNDPNAIQGDPNDPNNTPEAQARRNRVKYMHKADAASWALTYYLQKTRLAGMQKFYKELSRLPRDMRLDSEVVMKLFCKSFGLVKADQTPDPAAIRTFAQDWLQYMNNVPHFDFLVTLDGPGADPFQGTGGPVGVTGVGGGNPGGGGNQPGSGGNPPGGGGNPPGGGGNPPGRP